MFGATPAQREPIEGRAELLRVEGVDDRVDGRVEVAEPGDPVEEGLGDVAARQDRLEHVDDEERHPRDDEAAHDDRQRLGGFALLQQTHVLGAATRTSTRITVVMIVVTSRVSVFVDCQLIVV